jgi:predicted nucleic acid-binding Zn ribbon protein
LNGAVACIVCGAPVSAVRSTRKFCSGRCRQQRHRDRNAKRNGKRRGVVAILRKGTLAERGHDLYQTPPEAVLALLAAEDVPARGGSPPAAPAR